MDDAAGPSGLDAASWKRLCSCYSSSSTDLCSAIASIARKLCLQYVDPESISAFVACQLIALDKQLGVRPIEIGEAIRHIVNKAIAEALRDNIQEAAAHFSYVLDSCLAVKQLWMPCAKCSHHLKQRLRYWVTPATPSTA